MIIVSTITDGGMPVVYVYRLIDGIPHVTATHADPKYDFANADASAEMRTMDEALEAYRYAAYATVIITRDS